MLNMGLSSLFTAKQEKATPSISAIVLRKEDQERLLPLLKDAGFSIDDVDAEQDGIVIVKQEEFDAETAVTVRLKNDTAVILSNVEKMFTPYPETLVFDEKLKAAGFFPSVAMATDALMDTVHDIMMDARSPEDVKSKMEQAIQSYSRFVSDLANALPVSAFKIETLKAEDQKAEETPAAKAEGEPEDTAAKEASKEEHMGECPEGEEMMDGKCKKKTKEESAEPAQEEQAKEAVKDEGGKETASKDEGVDKEVSKEGEAAEKLAELIGLVGALKSELTEGLEGVKTDLEAVKSETKEFANRIEQVEATAKSAETAVKGTVVQGSDDRVPSESLGHLGRSQRVTEKAESEKLWSGSPVDNMLRL